MTCVHGHEGFCWDELTAQQKIAVNLLHEYAYNYALPNGRDSAEVFAGFYAERFYLDGVDEAPAFPRIYMQWRDDQQLKEG